MFLLQPPAPSSPQLAARPSYEVLAVRTAGYLLDRAARYVPLESLPAHAAALREGAAVPVGSVEYVRAAMAAARVREPASLSYPAALIPWLCRSVRSCEIREVSGCTFVKPQLTKQFTGFVHTPAHEYDEHDEEQFRAFKDLKATAPQTLVWVAEPVQFQSEVRFYVGAGRISGQGRYDSGEDSAALPDPSTIQAMIEALGLMHPYAIDAGVLVDGRTALVECNDFWALGLYGAALPQKDYALLLDARWRPLEREGDRVG